MYGGTPYAGGAYAGAGMVAADVPVDVEPKSAVEVSFTTDAFAPPVWVDISHDVRSWDVSRGRTKELERFQPGRLTVVLDNSDRDYDSQHATGPWFGNLRPMRRIRDGVQVDRHSDRPPHPAQRLETQRDVGV